MKQNFLTVIFFNDLFLIVNFSLKLVKVIGAICKHVCTVILDESGRYDPLCSSGKPLTNVDWCVAGFDILIEVCNTQGVERCGPHTVQELAQHEDKSVARQAAAALMARTGSVVQAQAGLLRHANLVCGGGEVRQGKDQRAQGHDQHTPAKPLGLVARTSEVADKGQTNASSNVIGAGDQAGLVAAQIKAPLDGRYHRVDEAIDDHPLKEGGHAQEEEHPAGCVEGLNALGCQGPPATEMLRICRDKLDPI